MSTYSRAANTYFQAKSLEAVNDPECSLCERGVKHAHSPGGVWAGDTKAPWTSGFGLCKQLTAAVADVSQPQDAQEPQESGGPADK